eukprot:symbB.v1.2.012132.t1/scaffold829.1/size159244/2
MDESLEELLEELTSRKKALTSTTRSSTAPRNEEERPKAVLPVLQPQVKRRSQEGFLKDQLREASRKVKKKPWLPGQRPKLQAPNVKIASPREFNPVLVLNEPFPHPWDGGRVDACRRHYPLWGLGSYMHPELRDKPPWKDPRRTGRTLRWDPSSM